MQMEQSPAMMVGLEILVIEKLVYLHVKENAWRESATAQLD